MDHFDYISYYSFLAQTIAIAVVLIILLLVPLLGVSIFDVLINIVYRAWVPRAAARAGDVVLGTRPVLPLGGWIGKPILWTGKDRAGRLALFLGRDADRMLRAVARRQYGPTVLVADPTVERNLGRWWDLWTRRADVPARPIDDTTADLLRTLLARQEPARIYIADVAAFTRRYPDLLPMILEPPDHIALSIAATSLRALDSALRDRLMTMARYYAIFRQDAEDLQLLLPYAPELPKPMERGLSRLRQTGRSHPVARRDLLGARRLRRKRCLLVAHGQFEGEVICWTGRSTALRVLI